ncbi:MAG: hypothetical protein PHR49_06090 [Methanoculleus sp.]|nr:hypothetical protein [Methanoculleus sp.]
MREVVPKHLSREGASSKNFVLLMHPPFRRVHLPGPSKNFVLLMHPPFRRVHLPGPSKNFVLLMHPPFRRVHLETRRVSQTPAVPAVAPRVTMPGGKPCRQFDARDHSIFRGDVSEYSELYESSATLFTEEPFGFFLPGTLQPRRALRAGRRLMRSYADNLTSSSW